MTIAGPSNHIEVERFGVEIWAAPLPVAFPQPVRVLLPASSLPAYFPEGKDVPEGPFSPFLETTPSVEPGPGRVSGRGFCLLISR